MLLGNCKLHILPVTFQNKTLHEVTHKGEVRDDMFILQMVEIFLQCHDYVLVYCPTKGQKNSQYHDELHAVHGRYDCNLGLW